MRAVADTNVLLAGLRSRRGASHELLRLLSEGRWILVLSNTLLTEFKKANMTTIEAKVPDYLARLTAEVAEREKVSVDQIVALALSAQVESWRIRDDVETRARRANRADFEALLDKVPDVPPMAGDELPDGYERPH